MDPPELRHRPRTKPTTGSSYIRPDACVDVTKGPPRSQWRFLFSAAGVAGIFMILLTVITKQSDEAPACHVASRTLFENELEARRRELLEDKFGIHELYHSATSLISHLTRTRDTLRGWDMPLHVQDAGLFHSVFGTERFRKKSVSEEYRSDVEAVIGQEASYLVYAFGKMDRNVFYKTVDAHKTELLDASSTATYQIPCGKWNKRTDGLASGDESCNIAFSRIQMIEMAAIVTANAMDNSRTRCLKQAPMKKLKKGTKEMEKQKGLLDLLPPQGAEHYQREMQMCYTSGEFAKEHAAESESEED